MPINGPANFSFTFSNASLASLSDWPPGHIDESKWKSGLKEIERHWNILQTKQIWSPWPILSFCVGSVEAPLPNEHLSPTQRLARQFIMERDGGGSETIKIRFFLFPHNQPTYQSQTVAQVICETKVGANIGDVKMWVDALREEELSDKNMEEIRVAININILTKKTSNKEAHMNNKSRCPACGSNDDGYYCENCDRYWCVSISCPNVESVIRNRAGLLEQVKNFSICQKCGRKGNKR